MKKLYILWCLLSVLLCAQGVRAQETSGRLDGRVVDGQGQPVPGVTIQAVHTPTGTHYGTVAGNDGRYHLAGLRVGGPYTIEASMVGMGSQKKENIMVRLGEPLQLSFVLADTKQQLSEVVVKATKGARANNTGAGQNISGADLRNMPTVSRSLQDMTRLTPQANKDNSFMGTNFRYNNVTLDGAINNDAIGFSPSAGGITGTSGMTGSSTHTNPISLDAIEDMQVYLSPFDVKIGNFTGGSINAVTRSGTNTFTGSVYGFGRNAALVGKDRVGSLGKENNDFYDYQTGVRLGFPIIKDKLFFFTNEEFTGRQDPTQLNVGEKETAQILSVKDEQDIIAATNARYGAAFNPGTAGAYNAHSQSRKFFNRLDWNINDKNQLTLRNNTVLSNAMLMDRDQEDFRFTSMAYLQTNNSTSTVAELKTRFNRRWANSLLVGYSVVTDKRDPQSDPNLPQVQIMGRTPGTTIYLGTDREGAIFDMKQRTWEVTDNVTMYAGKHTFTFGTHNELYKIDYGFVNSWNGRVDYLSIDDYINNNPWRVRGSYNYTDNSRAYILAHPQEFNIDLFSAYGQDEIQLTDKLKLTAGIRGDYTLLPVKPILSDKTQNAIQDGFLGNTYNYTPLNKITGNYFNRPQLSPRLGFRYDWLGDQSVILRGGVGMFTGRIPFAWLAYSFYNNGYDYGAFDQKSDQQAFVAGTDPLKTGKDGGIAGFIGQNGADLHNRNSGKTQVDVVDNNFVMPKVVRLSLALDYTSPNGYKMTVEGIYTKSIRDVMFQQVNIKDNPRYYGYDTREQQPVYSGNVDPRFANAYELSNTNQGYRYSATASIGRSFTSGFGFNLAYTYGESKDISNGIRNSMESNWQLNQALNPNNPQLAYSNFDIRHRIVAHVDYHKAWNARWVSSFTLFVSAQSGTPFSYGIVNNSVQGLPQQVSLAYIPHKDEAINFFQDYVSNGTTITAASQADAFNAYIDHNKYLSGRRGDFTERNMGRTPWNNQADFHFAQEYHFSDRPGSSFLTLSLDIMNLTNLINKNWGITYFSPNTFNSTASVGLTPVYPGRTSKEDYPIYTFGDPGRPYATDFFASRYQLQLGMRYSF